MHKLRLFAPCALLALSVGCGDSASTPDGGTPNDGSVSDGGSRDGGGDAGSPGTHYSFESRFEPGTPSTVYTGQVGRHLLIRELDTYLGALTDQTFPNPMPGDVVAALRFFYDFKNAGGDTDYPISSFGTPTLQSTMGEIGSLTSLYEKMPDQDADFQGGVVGWGDGTVPPSQVAEQLFGAVESLVIDRFNGNTPTDPSGAVIADVWLSPKGVDYRQLIQKFLTGAVSFSQAADDYLDDDLPGKGLLSDNETAVDMQPYTALEHAWDEGFGYFGAARDFNDYTAEEVAGSGGRPERQGRYDTNGDGRIDLTAENNIGHATNAAKRDLGSADSAKTQFMEGAFNAFKEGRTLIRDADGALSPTELTQLQRLRDRALDNWENAIAATVVHYINDVLKDMNKRPDDYVFADHAKHWSELKGFSLILQFNVHHSPWRPADYASFASKIGGTPVLPNAAPTDIEAYRVALREARALVRETYGFDAANIGDDNGEGGW